jgi:nucleoside diphosphate kinase
LVLSANNAVEKWREIIGPVDPNEAKASKPESLRSKLGKQENTFLQIFKKRF